MVSKIVARARRTTLVSTFGVGSLYPAENDSVMICGLDEWPDKFVSVLHEPRLAASLGVQDFRQPAAGRKNGDVPVVRFPTWSFCPKCRRIDLVWKLTKEGSRLCTNCNQGKITPSRFVACCEKGHIEDFPYQRWAHGKGVDVTDHRLKLLTKGESSALADLEVACETCGARRSLDGAFGFNALRELKPCGGRRPWLPGSDNDTACDGTLRTRQRGSSNVWFGATRSAISIPSVRERAMRFVRPFMKKLAPTVDPAAFAGGLAAPAGLTVQDLANAIIELRLPPEARHKPTNTDLRAEEYAALVNGLDETDADSKLFLCEEVDLTDSCVPEIVEQLSRVSRLREVRALRGFSRVTPADPDAEMDKTHLVPLSAHPTPWLPAMEVLGEGVFLRLDEQALATWCATDFATRRVRQILDSQEALSATSLASRIEVTARSLVLHSLAHVLLDEFSLTAGYPTASLRERVYAEDGQAGILIYTATADSAGSLGGLAALSDKHRFNSVFRSAIKRAEWCTSDPVCIESGPSGVDGMNLAACHACLLLPETSCEQFNLVLDRECLIGTDGLIQLNH